MSFEIIRDDITRSRTDAIVNPANPKPVIGGGTETAIHAAAGPQLLKARLHLGEIAPGCCEATRAYRLPARYVLHAVTPVWQGGEHGEALLLRRAYDAALQQAVRLRCRSVTFPLLGAGSNGFPGDLALRVAIEAFTDFLLTQELRITLTVFDRRAVRLAGALFDGVKRYIDDHYVDVQQQREYGQLSGQNGERRPLRAQQTNSAAAPEPLRAPPMFQQASPMFQQAEPRPQQASPMFQQASPKPQQAARKAQQAATKPQPEALQAMQFVDAAIPKDLRTLLNSAECSFAEYLISLLQEREEKDSAVYHRAQISRQLFHKLLNKRDYVPSKSTVIQLAIGLQLDLPQTQKLLAKAGYCLTRSNKTDLVVQYFISHREYNLVMINLALDDCGLPPLKQA